MSNLVDLKSYPVNTVLDILLKDRTTNKNIIFATESYENIDFTTEITKDLLLSGFFDIRPRVLKSMEEQTKRTRKKAEVFTPAWVCNKMNNFCDAEWFGRENVFNTEQGHEWFPTTTKIEFPEGKTWEDYVNATRLEITCGEAPYLVSRYDMVTGEMIPIEKRIGFLDRKLRVINENVNTRKTWNQWVYRAFESVYGYEFQGDNLLIARLNLLETYCEYTRNRWNEEPTEFELKNIANIISWNLWQMDGIHDTIPSKDSTYKPKVKNKRSLIENSSKVLYCKIYDWCDNKVIIYKSLKRG